MTCCDFIWDSSLSFVQQCFTRDSCCLNLSSYCGCCALLLIFFSSKITLKTLVDHVNLMISCSLKASQVYMMSCSMPIWAFLACFIGVYLNVRAYISVDINQGLSHDLSPTLTPVPSEQHLSDTDAMVTQMYARTFAFHSGLGLSPNILPFRCQLSSFHASTGSLHS